MGTVVHGSLTGALKNITPMPSWHTCHLLPIPGLYDYHKYMLSMLHVKFKYKLNILGHCHQPIVT